MIFNVCNSSFIVCHNIHRSDQAPYCHLESASEQKRSWLLRDGWCLNDKKKKRNFFFFHIWLLVGLLLLWSHYCIMQSTKHYNTQSFIDMSYGCGPLFFMPFDFLLESVICLCFYCILDMKQFFFNIDIWLVAMHPL